MESSYTYPGDELSLFQHAVNWKKYFSKQIKPYIKGKVLEVGAGIGTTTTFLQNDKIEEWWLFEPDDKMAVQLENKIAAKQLPSYCRLARENMIPETESFDTIIYIDVLEHIEDDKNELLRAAKKLRKNGHLIVLSPAFQFLYSPFDKSIGHFRRYNKQALKASGPDDCKLIQCKYLDSAGYFASLMNKLILKQKTPTLKQIRFWDRIILTVSTIADKFFLHSFGKSIIAVWQKSNV